MAYGKKKSKPKPKGSSDRKLSEEDLECWKALIEIAESYQKQYGNATTGTNSTQGRWDVNILALAGDFNSVSELGDEAVDVNLIASTAQTMLAPLWTADPYITVTPEREKYQDGDETVDNVFRARMAEHELNYWFRELDIKQVNKRCSLDDAATNQGVAYIGYISEKKDVVNDDGETTDYNPTHEFKRPFVDRISPKHLLKPPGYATIEECPWVALRFCKMVGDVRDRYGCDDLQADTKSIGGSLVDSLSVEKKDSLGRYGYVDLYQVWDKRGADGKKRLITLTKGYEDALEVRDWPVDTDGFPVEVQSFTMAPDQGYGMPWISSFMPQQKELNAARTAAAKRINRTKSSIFMDKEAKNQIADEYAKGDDGGIYGVDLQGQKMGDLMQIDTGLPVADAAYAYGSVQMSDLFHISGMGSLQRSQGDPNAPTATGSAIIDKWAVIRQSDFGDVVRRFYVNIARKLWMVLKQFPDVKRDLLVIGPDGTMQRVSYTLKDIRGEFAFSIDIGSMLPSDPRTRVQDAVATYTLFAADPAVNHERLIVDVLKAQQKHDVNAYLTRLMTPENEFVKMLQGLPVEAHELDDHMAHMAMHEQQKNQLIDLLGPVMGTPEEDKVRGAAGLLLAHVSDHMRIMTEIDSGNAKPGGEGAGNAVRDAFGTEGGGEAMETEAETGGQPLVGSSGERTDAGIPVN